MYFNVNDTTGLDESIIEDWFSDDTLWLSNKPFPELVERGLSEGEVRQSLLDRFREDVRNGELDAINKSLSRFGFGIAVSQEFMLSEEGHETIVQDIDNLIYELKNKEILGPWEFSDSTIYLAEDLS